MPRKTSLYAAAAFAAPFILSSAHADDDPRAEARARAEARKTVVDADLTRLINNRGVFNRNGLAPQVRITSPLNDGLVARGASRVGAGDPDGTGFVITLEVFTRDNNDVDVKESIDIRDVEALGRLNPDFPGLFVFIDEDLVTPDGTIIEANTNLGPLFNIAGTDDTAGPGVTIWAGWHVLESLPGEVDEFTITAAVVDNEGRIGFDAVDVAVDRDLASGNALTPNPGEEVFPTGDAAPLVEIIAPREPSAVARGEAPPDGSLHFIQVNVTDPDGDVVVDEIGQSAGETDGLGALIGRIDNPGAGVGNPNGNVPGFEFFFDAPFAGAGNEANVNLARLFNIAGSEIVVLPDGSEAVRTTLQWVVGAPFADDLANFVTLSARVTDASGNVGEAARVFRFTDDVDNGGELTPDPQFDDGSQSEEQSEE